MLNILGHIASNHWHMTSPDFIKKKKIVVSDCIPAITHNYTV